MKGYSGAPVHTFQLIANGVLVIGVVISFLHLNILHVCAEHITSFVGLQRVYEVANIAAETGRTDLDLLPRSFVQRLPKLLSELLLELIEAILRLEV